MKTRRLAVTPQAQRDLTLILAWYRRELGAQAAAKAARSIQAGVRATTRIDLARARREDLPEGYFRVVAKAHLVIFKVGNDTAKIVRILHGARDIAALLEPRKD
ncbi:MAG: type II toxin-antitoxin system RelE/ParE family toxin [Hyphomonadaceae bacterium]